MMTGIQSGFAIWLTGLPSSGKTTLAYALGHLLMERGIVTQVLDSDALRQKITPHPTYSPKERDCFYDLIAFLAEFLTDNGINVLIAATASRRAYRQAARDRIERFAEVYVACSPEVCRARDSKGLWRRADTGEITTLPGAGAPYEPPESPQVYVDTARLSVEEATCQIWRELNERDFFDQREDRTTSSSWQSSFSNHPGGIGNAIQWQGARSEYRMASPGRTVLDVRERQQAV